MDEVHEVGDFNELNYLYLVSGVSKTLGRVLASFLYARGTLIKEQNILSSWLRAS
jgi:hypothetical protein